MLVVLAIHAVAALLAIPLLRRFGPRAFLALATVPASAVVWAAVQARAAVSDDPPTQVVRWVPALGLDLAFRLDGLALLLVSAVGGVGALVFVYCAWYFHDGEANLPAFAAQLTGFAGAMLLVVTSDNMLLLYLGWELTTVFSWLLLGHDPTDAGARRAALQALLITSLGGLAMLLGFVVLGQAAGTYRISELVAAPPGGAALTGGALLVLAGALTKSAQVPFHSWLPRAMAAPTPVSAYLHSAAMVKAGIYLLLRFAPALAAAPPWRPVVLTLGLASMIIGGWRALRQYDLKLLLAYGTVSQLGFMTVLAGSGTEAAAAAAATVLAGHAMFKGTLFLTTGVIDHTAGTRDIRELSGLWRSHRVLLATAVLASASMAAIPPLLGFVGKESAYDVYLHGGPGGSVTLVGLVLGSVLTFAYSWRFVGGAFGPPKQELDRLRGAAGDAPGLGVSAVREARAESVSVPTRTHAVPAGFAAPGAVLALGGVLFGLAPGLLEPIAESTAHLVGPEEIEHLALWHGFTTALLLSVATVALGVALSAGRRRFARVQALLHQALPRGLDADAGYGATVRAVDAAARVVTGRTQVGSLPVYLGITMVVFAAGLGVGLLSGSSPLRVRAWDTPVQAVVALVVLVAALTIPRAHRRFTAVLLTGAVGYGVAFTYLLQGAPDVALTQLLVETLTLVAFVFVLRTLPRSFAAAPRPVATRRRVGARRGLRARALGLRRSVRVAISLAVGAVTGLAVLVMSSSRTATPVGPRQLDVAYPVGGGANVVNVLLTDFRAMDTFGEISVLGIAAVGILSLVAAGRRRGAPLPAAGRPDDPDRFSPQRRYIVLEVAGRLLFHTIAVFSVFLLIVGHNSPGGGFAGGLVLGLALVVRYLAGGEKRPAPGDPHPAARGHRCRAGAGRRRRGRGVGVRRGVPAGRRVRGATSRCSATSSSSPSSSSTSASTSSWSVWLLAVLRGLGAEISRRSRTGRPPPARPRPARPPPARPPRARPGRNLRRDRQPHPRAAGRRTVRGRDVPGPAAQPHPRPDLGSPSTGTPRTCWC